MKMIGRLVLASGSPRRKEILETLCVPFRVQVSDVPEVHVAGEAPVDYVKRLARSKALAVAQSAAPDEFVLGADTVVVIGDRILEKATNDAHARAMLEQLSGKTHSVVTGVALVRGESVLDVRAVSSDVVFCELDAGVIERYIASGEGRDKAGAYAVQGLGSGLVRSIHGSYLNVVGLPPVETLEILATARVLEQWP